MKQANLGPTVYGIEQEYSVTATIGPNGYSNEIVGECHSPDVVLGMFRKPARGSLENITQFQYTHALRSQGIYRNENEMLSNGGRFYIDPSGPEYCTPETTTAAEAVLRTFDGDRIMFGVLRNLQDTGAIKSFQLNRRVVDHNGASRGVHINTSTSHGREPSQEIAESLATLNAAKGAMFGSGGLIVNGQGHTEFHHSPRLSITNNSGEAPASYRERTLVRHPFKADVACRRIETITSDALNFAWPLRASMVMTNALVKLTEIEEYNGRLPHVQNPVTTARRIGHLGDGTIMEIINGYDTKSLYPSEVLRNIAELAIQANESYGQLDEESLQVLEEVIETADLLRVNTAAIVQRVESVARLEFMKRKIDELGVNWDSTKMCQYDYYWDKVGGGVAEKLREVKGWGWHGFKSPDSPEKAKKRLAKPPAGTRAELRGKLIGESKGTNPSGWYDFEFDDDMGMGHNVALHPLTTNPHV